MSQRIKKSALIKRLERSNDPEDQFLLGTLYAEGQQVKKDEQKAVECYDKAAKQGHPKAQTNLGTCYQQGRGVLQNDQKAAKWFLAAATQGNPVAQYNLALCYQKGQGVPKSDAQAAVWFLATAQQGVAESQCNLGVLYAEGRGVPQNHKEAAFWYKKAAEQKNAKAQFNLGILYSEGHGVPKDDKEAAVWYKKAAEQGHPDAQYNIGACHVIASGVQHDIQKAFDWLSKAAAQKQEAAQAALKRPILDAYRKHLQTNDPESQFKIGSIYTEGDGFTKDFKEAVRWYLRAAEQKHKEAQYYLGVFYIEGRQGVPANIKEGVEWLRKSANQGHIMAQYNLALSYLNGIGVAQNSKEAVKWFYKAAKQGYPKALFQMGLSYQEGDGVNKNLKEAAKWFEKAANLGYNFAQYNMGIAYLKGLGVKQDVKKAFDWLSKSVAGGMEPAKKTLAHPIFDTYRNRQVNVDVMGMQGNAIGSHRLQPIQEEPRGENKQGQEAPQQISSGNSIHCELPFAINAFISGASIMYDAGMLLTEIGCSVKNFAYNVGKDLYWEYSEGKTYTQYQKEQALLKQKERLQSIQNTWYGKYETLWYQHLDTIAKDCFDERDYHKALVSLDQNVISDLVALASFSTVKQHQILDGVEDGLTSPLMYWAKLTEKKHLPTLKPDEYKAIKQEASKRNQERSKQYPLKKSIKPITRTLLPQLSFLSAKKDNHLCFQQNSITRVEDRTLLLSNTQ